MDIVVCVKQTPDTTAEKRLDQAGRVERTGVENIVNPFDEYAIEEALRLKEAAGGAVTALCMGPPGALESLRKVLATGADRAVLISDPGLAGSDCLATARVLARALQRMRYDIVLFGMASTDSGMAVVPSAVAELLGLPQLSYAARVEVGDGQVTVQRSTAWGYEVIAALMPVVVSVSKGINEPRYPSLRGIMQARRAEIARWSLADLDLAPDEAGEAGARSRVESFTPVAARRARRVMTDDGSAAALLADFLEENGLI